jgi:hypothetical protein
MSLFNQIVNNWKRHQIVIIFLILFLVFLVLFQSSTQNREGFEITPSPSSNISNKTLSSLFFINNFPKQDFVKIREIKTEDNKFVSFWRREKSQGYFPIGHIAIKTNAPAGINDLNVNQHACLKYLVKGGMTPVDFEKIWDNKHLNNQEPLSIWKAITPQGYFAMSDIVVDSYDKPNDDIIQCLPTEVLNDNARINDLIFKHPMPSTSEEEVSPMNSVSVWNVGESKYGFFFAKDSYQKPLNRDDRIKTIKSQILNNQEYDPNDNGKILKVTLRV